MAVQRQQTFRAQRLGRAVGLILALTASTVGAAYIVALRSDQAGLPESILRETYAAIDRSRGTLIEACGDDGLWRLPDGTETLFPALALCDPAPNSYSNAIGKSLRASSAIAEGMLSKPWTPANASEAAYSLLLQAMADGESPPRQRLIDRLARTRCEDGGHAVSTIALVALATWGANMDGRWAGLANEVYRSGLQTPTAVSISALCRLKAGSGRGSPPGNDVAAHVRWLANTLELRFGGETPQPDPVTPESAFFVAMLASQLPRQMLLSDATLLPYNWRNHLANRLIAQQKIDPATGFGYWDSSSSRSPTSRQAIIDTTYAVMALVLMAE